MQAHHIVGAHPVAQLDGGFKSGGTVPVEVVAQFRVPDESFHEGHVREDVSIEQVSLIADVLQQRQCHRIGVGHAFPCDGCVAAFDVVNGNVGNGGQRIVDDTLVLVGSQ